MRVPRHLIGTALLATAAANAGSDDLGILSFPVGLVVGQQTIEVDLGPERYPAELFVDGSAAACTLQGATDACRVDLGSDPTIHLVELVRRDADGTIVGRARRWFNRPGQEAELTFLFSESRPDGVCEGRVVWLHPFKQHPVMLGVEHQGRGLRIGADGHSFAFPCPEPDVPDLLSASAIFPDGRRAEKITMISGFGGQEGVDMTAVPLTAPGGGAESCKSAIDLLGPSHSGLEDAGFEVVFVLGPDAGYHGLVSTSKPRFGGDSTWRRAEASLLDAKQIWFVRPDDTLSRINGCAGNTLKGIRSSSGKIDWLKNLFVSATLPFSGEPRLADAVAASGLVAAAGPRRRAIVLVLGDRADRDVSQFSPAQARRYLAEIGVPLFVFRIGRVQNDGWPAGVKTLNFQVFARALEDVRSELDRQCITWFGGDLRLDEVAERLPPGLAIAGRDGTAP